MAGERFASSTTTPMAGKIPLFPQLITHLQDDAFSDVTFYL